MTYDNWKTTNTADDELGSARQSGDRCQPEPTLVERLRRLGSDSGDEYDWEVCGRGADRIEALETALRQIAEVHVGDCPAAMPREAQLENHILRIRRIAVEVMKDAVALPLAAGSAT